MDKEAQEKLLNITEATEWACKEPTLLDALAWICVWESERVVKQARANPQWETCFKVCLQSVLDNYHKLPKGKPELEEKLRDKIVTLAVGIMIIVGKLKPEDLEEEDKDRFETICEAIKNQIMALIPDSLPEGESHKQFPVKKHHVVSPTTKPYGRIVILNG